MLRLSFAMVLLSGAASLGFSVGKGKKGPEEDAVPLGFARRGLLDDRMSFSSEAGSCQESSKESSPADEKTSLPGDKTSSSEASPNDESKTLLGDCDEDMEAVSPKDSFVLPNHIRRDIGTAHEVWHTYKLESSQRASMAWEQARKKWGRSAPSVKALETFWGGLRQKVQICSVASDDGLWEEAFRSLGYDVVPLNLCSGLKTGARPMLHHHEAHSEVHKNSVLFLNGVTAIAYPDPDKGGYRVGGLSNFVKNFEGSCVAIVSEDDELGNDWSVVESSEDIYSFTSRPMALRIYRRLEKQL